MITRMTFCLVVWFGVGFVFCFFLPGWVAFGILVSQPGMELGPSEVEARSPNCWTTREFLLRYINMKRAQFRTVGIVHYFYIKKEKEEYTFICSSSQGNSGSHSINKQTKLPLWRVALWENFSHSIRFFKNWEFHCLYHFTTPVPLSFLFFFPTSSYQGHFFYVCMYICIYFYFF